MDYALTCMYVAVYSTEWKQFPLHIQNNNKQFQVRFPSSINMCICNNKQFMLLNWNWKYSILFIAEKEKLNYTKKRLWNDASWRYCREECN